MKALFTQTKKITAVINACILRWKKVIRLCVITFFLVLALLACYDLIEEINLKDLHTIFNSISYNALLLSLGATIVSFSMLIGYEYIALEYRKIKLPKKSIVIGGFCAFSFGNALGLSIISGSAVRYRFYHSYGVKAMEIAAVTLFSTLALSFSLPLITALLVIVVDGNVMGNGLGYSIEFLYLFAWIICGLYIFGIIYLFCPTLKGANKGNVNLGHHHFSLPSLKLLLCQFLLTVIDVTSSACVLYFLFPNAPPFSIFLLVYCIGLILGMLSHIPGGFGVFEAIILHVFSSTIGVAELLAALVLYRLIYVLLPLLIASVCVLMIEVRKKTHFKVSMGHHFELAPSILAILVFIVGIVLVLSGATPAIPHRLHYLSIFIPESLINHSHLLASIIGMLCLFLAHELYNRISVAFTSVIILLIFGMLCSLLKGIDWEEALFSFLVICLLLQFRRLFYRNSRLTQIRFSLQYFIVIGGVLIVSWWLMYFSYTTSNYHQLLWWQLDINSDAPRSLRALVAMVIIYLFFGLKWLFHPTFRWQPPTLEDLTCAFNIYQKMEVPDSGLALMGDKALLFNEQRTAFIMYAQQGNSLIALFDPIGPYEEHHELIWQFKTMCSLYQLRPVFYQVSDDNAHEYLSSGLRMIKTGEEAFINLSDFSLEGHAMKNLRHIYHQAEANGLTFKVYAPGEAPLEILKTISIEWLTTKHAREKKFSLGYFDESYLKYFSIGVVLEREKVVAFTNLLAPENKVCASFDLMRTSSTAPKGTMQYLIISLILYYQSRQYHRVTLGASPLFGLEDSKNTSLIQRIGNFLYQNGEYFYNFQGVHDFKNRYHPH